MTKKAKQKIRDEIEGRIQEALDTNGPYSHNIISSCLRRAETELSKKDVIELFDLFELDSQGWTRPAVERATKVIQLPLRDRINNDDRDPKEPA
jgi:hypothetical protein